MIYRFASSHDIATENRVTVEFVEESLGAGVPHFIAGGRIMIDRRSYMQWHMANLHRAIANRKKHGIPARGPYIPAPTPTKGEVNKHA